MSKIHCYDGALQSDDFLKALTKSGRKLALFAHEGTASLYAQPLQERLQAPLFTFPAGEEHKTRRTKETLEDALLERGFGRNSLFIAVGGGVVLDLVGFIAATFCRGVPYFSCPTTLLAMVDACYGGKTGVNTPHGKNLIGSFHPAEEIWIDPLTLETLPKRELNSAYAEIVKYGLIDPDFPLEFPKERAVLILRCLEAKRKIVEADPQEKIGLRALLNFGHTLAHALESLSAYQGLHGEAVSIGICFALSLSEEVCGFPPAKLKKIRALLASYNLPTTIPPEFSSQELIKKLHFDKKKIGKEVSCVLLKEKDHYAHIPFLTPVSDVLLERHISLCRSPNRS